MATTAAHPDAGTLVPLEIPGFAAAVVAIAESGVGRRPVVIAAHGNWDRPMWECQWWRHLFPESFVLCPRGFLRKDSPSADDPRYDYKNDKLLEAETDAGLQALVQRFGERVDLSLPIIWVGLSRGAFLGARIAARRADRFPALILVEGGHDPWTAANAKRFADNGGKRVLFICGQGACTILGRRAARQLEHAGVATQLFDVPGMGHGLNGDAAAPIREALPWLRSQTD